MATPAGSITESVSSTPRILWRGLFGIWLLTIVLLVVLIGAVRVERAGARTIGQEVAPAIIAAQHIKAALADMDANAANELLGAPGQTPRMVRAYESRREEAAAALIEAARNIASGQTEEAPILRIQLGIGRYEALIERARSLREEANPAYVAMYGKAADFLDREVLQAADALDEASLAVLSETYRAEWLRAGAMRGFVEAAAFGLLCIMGYVQYSLTKRVRRLINIPLLAATVLAAGFTIYALRTLGEEQDALKVAGDSFTSIHALWRARAEAYSAKADESRFLLEKASAPRRELDFFSRRDKIAKVPAGETIESVAQARAADRMMTSFSGYIADNLRAINFPGEQEAALAMLRAFGEYLKVDSQIRSLENNRNHAAAIALCIGTAPGESQWSFERFDGALDRTLQIDQQYFDEAVKGGFVKVDNFEVKSEIFAVLVAGLALAGVMQRVREYR